MARAPAEIFVGGGGASLKKASQMEKKVVKTPQHVKNKALIRRKNIAKKAPTKGKSSKQAPHIANNFFVIFQGGGSDGLLLPLPLRAPMNIIVSDISNRL